MRLDAFIFDLDGTLADSIGDIGEATNSVLAAHGLKGHGAEAYKRFVGEGAEVLVRRAFSASLGGDWHDPTLNVKLPAPLPDLVEAYRLAYDAQDHRLSLPYPGVDVMLDGVAAARRRMAVLSNKRDDFTKHLIHKQFSRWVFADVRGERDGVPRKPDPSAAIELALALNVLPARIGFVGDTPIDMRTARSAGMVPIGALWGFRTRDELLEGGARHLLEVPADLLKLL
jgi:phosphoglycolate phosphatase